MSRFDSIFSNYSEIENFKWDSEGGYYSYILYTKIDLPYSDMDWTNEIKWLKLSDNKDEDIYEEVERPDFYERTFGFL